MTGRTELASVCVQVRGFPSFSSPEEVAERISDVIHVPVRRIAPAHVPPSDARSQQIWIIQLDSANDQTECLNNHRTFNVDYGNSQIQVKLGYPYLNYVPSPGASEWISVEPPSQQDQSFVVIETASSGAADVSFDEDIGSECPREEDLCGSSTPLPPPEVEWTGDPSVSFLSDSGLQEEENVRSFHSLDDQSPFPPIGRYEASLFLPSDHVTWTPKYDQETTAGSEDPQMSGDDWHQFSARSYENPGRKAQSFMDPTKKAGARKTHPLAWPFTASSHEQGSGRPEVWSSPRHTATKSDGRQAEAPKGSPQYSAGHGPFPGSKIKSASQEPIEEEREPLRTIEVTVGRPIESLEMYLMYFQIEDIGGDDVEDIQEIDKEKGILHVTFVSPEVAKRVSQREHIIAKHKVQVKLYVPPKPKPTYPDKLLFKNLADSTSKDSFRYYLENITGMEPVEILYGDEAGVVLVTFEREPNFAKVKTKCTKRTLEGNQLTVSRVPISNCVLVENLGPSATPDLMEFYFRSKRGKGGKTEKVVLEKGENSCRCYVYFVDHEIVDRVLETKHVIDKRQLKVTRYMECLGLSGGSADPRVFSIPQSVVLTDLDKHKLAFVRHFAAVQESLNQQLAQIHAQPALSDTALTLSCTLEPDSPDGRALARSWTEDVEQAINSFLDQIEVFRVDVMEQVRPELDESLAKNKLPGMDKVLLQQLPKESALVIVGMKKDVKQLSQQISQTVKAVEEQIERRKQEITETVKNLKPHQLRLLQARSFPEEDAQISKDIHVSIDTKENTVILHGLLADVKQIQVNMLTLLMQVKHIEVGELSAIQRKLLEQKETAGSITQKLNTRNIVAVFETDQQSGVLVYAFSVEDVEAAVQVIRTSIQEYVFELNPQSVDLLRTADWHSLKIKLEGRHSGTLLLTPSHDGRKIFVAASADILQGVVEEVGRFVEENTIYSETVCFPESRQKFISSFRKHEFLAIGKDLQAYRVKVSLTKSDTEIAMQGTSKGLEQARKKLLQLDEQTMCHKEVLIDLSKVKFLSSEKCVKELQMMGKVHQCVIAFQAEPAGFLQDTPGNFQASVGLTAVTSEALGGNMKIFISIQTPIGATVAAVQGDITQMKVDVIVNAANNRMEHAGGLAKAIVDKGGRGIQEECYSILKSRAKKLSDGDVLVSGPGKLPCKSIIHAVGPFYTGGHRGEDECLENTVMNCLETASQGNHMSIALPAISTGVFQYPVAAATKVIVNAVKKYLEEHRMCSVKAVYLCHIQADQLRYFCDAIQSVFRAEESPSAEPGQTWSLPETGPSFVYPKPQPRRDNRAGQKQPATNQNVGSFHAASSGSASNVVLKIGELAQENVDVIVNTTAKDLNLRNGGVSSSVLAAAGQGLQNECRAKYPTGINIGDIARTRGFSLACKEVFHVVLCQWTKQHSQQIEAILNQTVTDCLNEASKAGYTSIAFPVLGTGNLQYPQDFVARIMLSAINQFKLAAPSTSLRDVRIVVFHKDKPALQVFQQMQSQSGVVFNSVQPTGSRQRRRYTEETAGASRGPTSRLGSGDVSDSAEFDISGLRLVIKQGDITQEAVDTIVNSSNSDLDLNRGGVAIALQDKCGPRLVKECQNKVGDMKKHGIAWTEAYGLRSRLILHVNVENFQDDSEWEAGIKKCLSTADGRSIQTMAFPALGTGTYAVPPDVSANFLYKALKSFSSKRQKLQEVRVVLFDSGIVPDFIRAVQARIEKDKGGFFNTLKGMVGLSTPQTVQLSGRSVSVSLPAEVTLYIYAESQGYIQACLRGFDELVQDKFTTQVIEDNILPTLGPVDIDRIQQVGRRYAVDISVQTQMERLVLHGLQTSVPDTMREVTAILRSAMLASMVQWYYIEVGNTGTEQVAYGPKENQIIEDAFQKGDKNARIQDSEGKELVIDFSSMKDSAVDDPNDIPVDVIRKIKMKGADSAGGELPASWGSMKKDDDPILVPLTPTDKEYQDVVDNFKASIGNIQCTAKSVQRVQNPTLYRQYSALKAQMTRQNPGITNEKTLWHGTSGTARDNINRYGFNRSYCGKNAVQYGQGVYFAVQSSYSASTTYSPPDAAGHRYMYMCKVLVGHFTPGNPQMRVLPPRQGSIQYDSATDNLKNPWMYVIFNDTQAYPEYLITFQ